MKHDVAPVLVFRVARELIQTEGTPEVTAIEPVLNPTLVIEYVERGEFRDIGGSTGVWENLLAEGAGTESPDKYTFHALDVLRYHWLHPDVIKAERTGRSIDEAVDQRLSRYKENEARAREMREFTYKWSEEHPFDGSTDEASRTAALNQALRERFPPHPPESGSDVTKRSGDVLLRAEGSSNSLEEWERMEDRMKQHIRSIWAYGRGKRLEWKRVASTPAGRDCEVLTEDGAELLYPGPDFVETSPPK